MSVIIYKYSEKYHFPKFNVSIFVNLYMYMTRYMIMVHRQCTRMISTGTHDIYTTNSGAERVYLRLVHVVRVSVDLLTAIEV